MKVQTLISAMHQNDEKILSRMNIQTDSILINQSDRFNEKNLLFNGNKINILSFKERGVGLSRNNALMRSNREICIFADEDLSYVDGYEDIILKEFADNPKADLILFNVPSTNEERPTYLIPKKSRVRWYNSQRYGAVKIAVKTAKIKQANIYFSLLFGGGAKYSAGEDSLFISDCLKKGLKIYANPEIIGYVNQVESSWFEGYTEKYFFDKGAFFATISKRWSWFLCLQFSLRHRNLYSENKSIIEAFKLMLAGTKEIGK
ncbi:hypothetical protein V6B14_03480 [Sporosarcina psychrophila]|uniref:hypothetical protein n=1 Tax=Sporosarcina psychrophila TaxID=1476 RepID=UPI0030D21200